MIEGEKDWGEFSEWLDHIDQSLGGEQPGFGEEGPESSPEGISFDGILSVFQSWIKQLEEAPVTTWKEELSVRGFDYEWCSSDSDVVVSEKLWSLLNALAGMRIFVTNTDHLSERELYELLVNVYIVKQVAQVPLDRNMACMIDIVGSEIEDNPANWLRYYASSRERLEWAKQNVGKMLPTAEKLPYSREDQLPTP